MKSLRRPSCRSPPKRLSRRPLLRSPRRPPRRQWTEARTLGTSATATASLRTMTKTDLEAAARGLGSSRPCGRSLCGSCLDAKASASLHRHRHGLADREATAMAELCCAVWATVSPIGVAESTVVALLVEAGFPQCLLSGGIRAPPKELKNHGREFCVCRASVLASELLLEAYVVFHSTRKWTTHLVACGC